MAKKGQKSDDVLDLVLDSKVLSIITDKIMIAIRPAITEIVKDLVSELKEEIIQIAEDTTTKLLDKFQSSCDQKLKVLSDDTSRLKIQMDTLSNLGNSSSLLVYGLSECDGKDEISVTSLVKDKLGIAISPNDISSTYRMRSKNTNSPCPLVVSFIRKTLRDSVLAVRKKLRFYDAPG